MSRINVIALVLFIAAVVWAFTFDNDVTRSIQAKATSLMAPFQRSGRSVETSLLGEKDAALTLAELKKENEALKVDVAALRIQAQEISRLLEENHRFRDLLNFEKGLSLKLIPAQVIGRDVSTWWSEIVINRGRRHGVVENSPVVTDRGLVGKTKLVTEDETKVILLTDERCQLGAMIGSGAERGIIMGSRGATRENPDLRLRFLDKNAKPGVGAKVRSSNAGRLFPAGILLGEVKSYHSSELETEVLVRPAVDFGNLEFLFVIEREDARPLPGDGADRAEEPVSDKIEEEAGP